MFQFSNGNAHNPQEREVRHYHGSLELHRRFGGFSFLSASEKIELRNLYS